MNEETVGREPVQIVEIEQPVCSHTYGVLPCTAALGETGERKCYNTRATCQDTNNYNASDTIKWRFVKPHANQAGDLFDADGHSIATNPIPSLMSVTTSPTKINIGGGSESESPFGRRASMRIVLQDHPWDDSVGDFYVHQREFNPVERGSFWAKWLARNPFYARMTCRVYDGYVGQSLGQMVQRQYQIDTIKGPDANGQVTITAKDILRLADDKRSQFPRVTDAELRNDIDESQTSGIVIVVDEAELDADYGNTGNQRYLRIDNEIIRYTGHSEVGTNEHQLTGVQRGALGTEADEHDAEDHVQRVGRYEQRACWLIAADLIENHTPVPSGFIPLSDWNAEGNVFLPGFIVSGTVADPTPVNELLGELCEQCLFYLWWDERAREIKLRAIRPPIDDPVASWDDDRHILRDSSTLDIDPEQRLSRVFVYFRERDPTARRDDVSNYSRMRGRVDLEAEGEDEYGESRTRRVFSRWLQTTGQAIQTSVLLLMRYRDNPRFLTLRVDAKDRGTWTADVVDVSTRTVVDDTGAEATERWQVISAEEIQPGEVVEYDLQSFQFHGRFGRWMADDAPSYADASPGERELGGWWAGEDGLVNGDEGYQWI